MSFIEDLESARTEGGTALTIGVFDGVHLGHRHLLTQLRALAQPGLASCVITFLNHPRTILSPGGPPHLYLMPRQKRIDALRGAGVDRVIPMDFTAQISQLTYREFVQILVDKLNLKKLLIGPDFAMGKRRGGTGPSLTELGRELGYTVTVAEPYTLNGQVVSTTAIRQIIEAGDMRGAEMLLGRPFSLEGPVINGEARGRLLGFPTANVEVPQEVVHPPNGIYSTVATTQGHSHLSVTSIGVRPTFGGGQRTVETYIMDFNGDLYGQTLKIELQQRIRDEQRFDSVNALIAQMHKDVATAWRLLSPFIGGGG